MKVQQVFTPNDTPTITYVDRTHHKLEQTLQDHYDTPKMIVSVSGPSKSGKTVLIKKVVPEENLIPVVGAAITSAENLWERVLHWMGEPMEVTETKVIGNEISGSAEAGGKIKIIMVAEGEAKGTIGGSRSWGNETSETRRHGGIDQVAKEIAGSEFVVFIDDFHYIRPEFREEIGRQIKAAAENGVKIFTASVPHRQDDVVRSNPELRGRVASLNMSFWSGHELVQIANKGFAQLNVDLSPAVLSRFAAEASGSPQLMQAICLNLCFVLNIRETREVHERVEVDEEVIAETLLRTSSFADFSKMVTALHTGAKTRGTERKIHALRDDTKGDVYRAILLAVRQDPTKMSFTLEDINARVKAVCVDEPPVGSSVNSALEQMHLIAEELQPGTSPLVWDGDTLDIADPYLLFFLRCSGKLAELTKP